MNRYYRSAGHQSWPVTKSDKSKLNSILFNTTLGWCINIIIWIFTFIIQFNGKYNLMKLQLKLWNDLIMKEMLKLCIYNTSNSSKWSFKENNSQAGLMRREIILISINWCNSNASNYWQIKSGKWGIYQETYDRNPQLTLAHFYKLLTLLSVPGLAVGFFGSIIIRSTLSLLHGR